MFLIERFVSLLVYAFALFFACYLIGVVVRKQWQAVLLLYLACLCVFAYCYQPYITADLYRLRQYIRYWTGVPWAEILSTALKYSVPSWVLYSYIISKLGNINWLQTITCLWCFGNIFYIISHEIERNMLQRRSRSMMLFYVMAVGALFLQTISGIRSMLGISIVAFCFYRETVEHKAAWPHVAIYLFAALLHSSTLILVISRLVFFLIQVKAPHKRIAGFVAMLILGIFSSYFLIDFIGSAFETGRSYLENKNEYTYSWEILIGSIETLETIYVMWQFRKRYKNDKTAENDFMLWKLCLLWTAICIMTLPFSYTIFRRYTIFCTIISVPLLGRMLRLEQRGEFDRNIWIFSCAIFALSGIRGDLCGYKFFILH